MYSTWAPAVPAPINSPTAMAATNNVLTERFLIVVFIMSPLFLLLGTSPFSRSTLFLEVDITLSHFPHWNSNVFSFHHTSVYQRL
jgi:hypothetical protein